MASTKSIIEGSIARSFIIYFAACSTISATLCNVLYIKGQYTLSIVGNIVLLYAPPRLYIK